MASVFLNWTPPDREELVKLYIYEAAAAGGPWTLIETLTEIGDYPNYISDYTTTLAQDAIHWFSIQWEDAKGAKTTQSNPIQGGTSTYVGEIVDRVHVRDASLDEQVVLQETEAIVEQFFNKDPYTVPANATGYAVKNSIAKAVHAKCLYAVVLTTTTGGASSWTAGLVSMKSSTDSTKQTLANVELMLKEASRELGMGVSVVAQMVGIEIAGGLSQIVSADISRLLIEVE